MLDVTRLLSEGRDPEKTSLAPQPRLPDRLGQRFQDGGIVGRRDVDDAQVQAFGGEPGRLLDDLPVAAVLIQAEMG